MKRRTENRNGGLGDRATRVMFFFRRLPKPQVVLFGLFLIYCILMFLDAMQARKNPFVFSQWMLVRDLMFAPLLLLVASFMILINRLSSTAMALGIGVYLFYVTGYRGMISIPNSHGVPIFSLDAIKIWFTAMPSNLILQAVFATFVLIVGTIQLVRLVRANQTAV